MGSDEKNVCQSCKGRATGTRVNLFISLVVAGCLAGCGDGVRMPTAEQLAAFEKTSYAEPMVDMARIEKARLYTGPYRVIPGDVLEFTMPALLRAIRAAEVQAAQAPTRDDQPYICRVNTRGTITLPAIGEIEVTGLSLAEIEDKAIEGYQRYVVLQPSVYVRVLEYRTAKVYITGAVKTPGVYTLRADQMTLVSLITEANGISESGASVVRIVRPKDQTMPAESRELGKAANHQRVNSASPGIVLPVVGMNIPFRDVALDEGDTVVVEQIRMPLFSVLGLVTSPGNFEYPPTAEYNLAQAIAYAGGLDPIADPRYVTIYRLDADGSILRIPFQLINKKDELTEALNTPIRPGDVVSVEHTPRTRTNMMINNLLRINTGVYITGDDLWDGD